MERNVLEQNDSTEVETSKKEMGKNAEGIVDEINGNWEFKKSFLQEMKEASKENLIPLDDPIDLFD